MMQQSDVNGRPLSRARAWVPAMVALVTVAGLGVLREAAGETVSVSGDVSVAAATYYISPGGSDSNPGTLGRPFATLQKGHNVANPGDTIYMRGGTYRFQETILTRDGTSSNRIKIFAYANEKPVIDAINQSDNGSRTGVIQLNNASWWHIKGLELKNGPTQGIHAHTNANNNIFELLNIHHMGRRGLNGQGNGISVWGRFGGGGGNLILNNDVHDNENQLTSGGGANGINIGEVLASGNVIRGNRAWCNSDDGIDLWSSHPAMIENNWVWKSGQGINCRATGGDGFGFKLGGKGSGDGGHTVRNNLAWGNKVDGFHENGGDRAMRMYHNTAWNNGRNSFWFSNPATAFRNNISHDSVGRVEGNQPFNSWTLPVTVNNADFASLNESCAYGPRQANGSLPNCSFLKLVAGSDLIDKGTDVGIPFTGRAPDLGAFEFGGTPPTTTTAPPTTTTAPPTTDPPGDGTLELGTTALLGTADNGNGNKIHATKYTLSRAATLESLSFYVRVASGDLRLGVYAANGPNGGPGTLKAQTASIPTGTTTGWRTTSVTPVALPAGDYWLAYLPSNNTLGYLGQNSGGVTRSMSHTFGPMPTTFSTTPGTTPWKWSMYATLSF